MTNTEFKELSVEARATFFAGLTNAEVEVLTVQQRKAYDEWAGAGADEDEQEEALPNAEDLVAQYIKDNPEYIHEAIFLTSDGLFFPHTIKGENAVQNYCGTTKTYKTYNIIK